MPRNPPFPSHQGCALWHNWWPLLTAFVYVLVPMPMLFFGGAPGGGYGGGGGNGWVARAAGRAGQQGRAARETPRTRPPHLTLIPPFPISWADAGKFLTGFSAVAALAVPAVLYHSGRIAGGALAFELAAVTVLGGTVGAYSYLADDGYY